MTLYYVDLSPDADGSHHLHSEDCDQLATATTLRLLGDFGSSTSALLVAKILFEQVRECSDCTSATNQA